MFPYCVFPPTPILMFINVNSSVLNMYSLVLSGEVHKSAAYSRHLSRGNVSQTLLVILGKPSNKKRERNIKSNWLYNRGTFNNYVILFEGLQDSPFFIIIQHNHLTYPPSPPLGLRNFLICVVLPNWST